MNKLALMLVSLVACGGTTTSTQDAGVPDAASDATPGDYGQCGQTVHSCLCACSGGTTCESACYTPACTKCIDTAATSCCPIEYPAYTKCIGAASTATDAGPAPCSPNDTACILAQCKAESSALQTCLATPQCKTANAACNGSVKCP